MSSIEGSSRMVSTLRGECQMRPVTDGAELTSSLCSRQHAMRFVLDGSNECQCSEQKRFVSYCASYQAQYTVQEAQ